MSYRTDYRPGVVEIVDAAGVRHRITVRAHLPQDSLLRNFVKTDGGDAGWELVLFGEVAEGLEVVA